MVWAGGASAETVSEWQARHCASCGWGEPSAFVGGGLPWQESQASCVPSTFVQIGVFAVPPWSDSPWQ
jgi:hypothetical protein